MIVFHFSWDLDFFGFTQLGVMENPRWQLFAQSIAGTFLFTVGISLHLAHGGGVKWRSFLRRLAILLLAAAAISLASWFFDPEAMIWFGILHCIALSSVIGLAFLRLPALVTALAAAAAFTAPHILTSDFFNPPYWLWLGLSNEFPPADDYIPLLPWFGFVLAGIAVAKTVLALAPMNKFTAWQPRLLVARTLVLAGRHSLIVYLAHQPLLVGALWLFTQAVD